jgi:hypothetical protein
MTRRTWSYIIFAVLCLAFILTRLAILNSQPLYQGFSMRIQPDVEEFYTSNVAIEIIKGPLLPLVSYSDRPYEGYIVVNGLLTVPFFLLLGPSYFALKLTALLFGLLILISLFYFSRREFGLLAAAAVSLLYIFAPPGIIRLSLWASGHYPHSQLFLVLSMILIYRICFPRQEKRILLPDVIMLGLLSGFSIYFHPICILILIYCLLSFACFRRDFFRTKRIALFLFMTVLGSGVLPLRHLLNLYSYVYFPGRTTFFSQANAQNILQRVVALFSRFFAQIWYYEDISLSMGMIFDYAFYFLLLTAYFFLLTESWRKMRHSFDSTESSVRKVIILLLFPPIIICAFSLSNFIQPFNPASVRFILPLYPVICLIIVLFLFSVGRVGNKALRISACLIGALLIIINAAGTINLFSSEPSMFRDMDTSWGWVLGEQVAGVYLSRQPESALDKINRERHGEYKEQIKRGFADSVAALYWSRGPSYFRRNVDAVNDEFHPEIYRAFGRKAAYHSKFDLEKCRLLFEEVPAPMRRYCYEGVGSTLGYRLIAREPDITCEQVRLFSKEIASVPPQYRADCYRGLGAAAVWEYEPRTHIRRNYSEERLGKIESCVPQQYRSALEEGKDIGYYRFPEW